MILACGVFWFAAAIACWTSSGAFAGAAALPLASSFAWPPAMRRASAGLASPKALPPVSGVGAATD